MNYESVERGRVMCAQFMIRGSTRDMAAHFKAHWHEPADWNGLSKGELRVLPFSVAPVVIAIEGERQLRLMRFHLTPRWAKEAKVKWATYNARLESIHEKASFRAAFREHHCLVIMSGFVEAIYEGPHAGFMVEFQGAQDQFLAAAGIFEEWVHPQTGEVLESFAIITDDPGSYVLQMGHDRQPLFPRAEAYEEWLRADQHSPSEWVSWLRHQRQDPPLTVRRDRPMRPGWEKRKPD